MMKMKKMLFVFNPRSGKEAIKNQLSDILGIFCGAGYLPSVYVTQEPGDAAKIAEEYGKDVELFVCSGGDGTLNRRRRYAQRGGIGADDDHPGKASGVRVYPVGFHE